MEVLIMEFNQNFDGLKDELTALQNTEISKSAEKESEINQLKVCVNSAARVGQRHAVWMRPLTSTAKTWLKANGYDCRPLRCSAEPGSISIIEW